MTILWRLGDPKRNSVCLNFHWLPKKLALLGLRPGRSPFAGSLPLCFGVVLHQESAHGETTGERDVMGAIHVQLVRNHCWASFQSASACAPDRACGSPAESFAIAPPPPPSCRGRPPCSRTSPRIDGHVAYGATCWAAIAPPWLAGPGNAAGLRGETLPAAQ